MSRGDFKKANRGKNIGTEISAAAHNSRDEVWNKILYKKKKTKIILWENIKNPEALQCVITCLIYNPEFPHI